MGRSDDDSPSPPRGHRRRTRSPSPRGSYGGHGKRPTTNLMVTNLGPDCRRASHCGFWGSASRSS
uniref:Uncharacterized protein n=1 Tax=Zea mays TaxID=4577 RepID=B6UHA0_MAIZE|nr:hypothetical protein [Zea mays]